MQLAAARGELGLALRRRRRELGKVGELRREFALGLRRVGRLDAVAQLILGEAARGEVLADVLDGALALLIGDAQVLVAGIGHARQFSAHVRARLTA